MKAKQMTGLLLVVVLCLVMVTACGGSETTTNPPQQEDTPTINQSDTPTELETSTLEPTPEPTLEPTLEPTPAPTAMTADALEQKLQEWFVVVTSVKMSKYGPEIKLKNNSEDNVRDVVVGYVAWDHNDLPLKNYSDYFDQVKLTTVNMVAGGTYSGSYYSPDFGGESGTKTMKAVIVSYTTFDDTIVENPYAVDFENIYAGKVLSSIS